jgi:hypothetical protein
MLAGFYRERKGKITSSPKKFCNISASYEPYTNTDAIRAIEKKSKA